LLTLSSSIALVERFFFKDIGKTGENPAQPRYCEGIRKPDISGGRFRPKR
jgi:hypothetical protein